MREPALLIAASIVAGLVDDHCNIAARGACGETALRTASGSAALTDLPRRAKERRTVARAARG
ncbi:MAG TPA: hypothetical protein VEI02_02350, partial [Planctomycetota bacterium]|nr:hypothetical protein [Planctomycetota bacterium]